MIVPFFLFVLFTNFLSASSEKCKSNNDCERGRCERRRCVAKIERTKSGRKDAKVCYDDNDCNRSGEIYEKICKLGLCVPLKRWLIRVQTNWECIQHGDCGWGHRCGMYRKCYDMSTGRYVEQSLMLITSCKNKAPSYCPNLTGFPESVCQLIEDRSTGAQNYVCGYPNFDGNYDISIECNDTERHPCPPYYVCVAHRCFNRFWATVGERCVNDGDCHFNSYCQRWDGRCTFNAPKILDHSHCRVSADCNSPQEMKRMVKICHHFRCMRRRSSAECSACKFDEYCDLRQSCIRVQRPPDFDCDRGNQFYWYGAMYCSVRKETTYNEAFVYCGGNLASSPYRGTESSFDPEQALILYLAIREGWVIDNADKVEKKFVNWANHMERNKKSSYFCKNYVSIEYIPNNATTREPKCQTLFSFHDGYCYHGGFTNFMPRFAIRTICNLLDSEIVRIKNKEEAHIVYGIAGGRSFWLGLRREKRDWYWDSDVFGYRARFFFWRTGQPDLSQGNCVYSPTAGEWMSADCDRFTSPRAYICKRAPFKD